MAFTLSPSPGLQFLDDDGHPLSSGKVYTYVAGLTTPATTYADVDGTPNSNPITLDAGGWWPIYLTVGATYKFIIKTAAGATVRTLDDIASVPSLDKTVGMTGLAGMPMATGDPIYLADGTGTHLDNGIPASDVAGLWYLTHADQVYASWPQLGVCLTDTPLFIGLSTPIAIHLEGKLSDLGTFAAGQVYYLSDTVGTLSSTPGTYARKVGTASSSADLVWNPVPMQIAGAIRASVYNSAAQSIPNAAVTTATFDTEEWDIGGCHSTVTNTGRMTVPTGQAGLYTITGQVTFASNTTGRRYVVIRKNGTTDLKIVEVACNQADVTTVVAALTVSLAAADYLEFQVFQSSGGALNAGSATLSVATRLQFARFV